MKERRVHSLAALLLSVAVVCATPPVLAQDQDPPKTTDLLDLAGVKAIQKEDDKWAEYLTDTSASSVSAAGMLGISGESITTIENVRNLTVAMQALGANDTGQTLGLSITPARTSLAPMNLSDYARSVPLRILGSLTLGYAQGPISIESVEYKRKAWAVDTNFFFNGEDDPVIAFGRYAAKNCDFFGDTTSLDSAPGSVDTAGELPTGDPGAIAPAGSDAARAPGLASADETSATAARLHTCHEASEAELRWNRSQMSISYGEARIRLDDNSKPEESLGRTLALSIVYGFDHLDYLRDNFALTMSYRRTTDEPVLATLAQPATVFKDSSLFVGKLSGGSKTSRILFEFSNAKSRDVTASQRAFKQALGIDYRLTEAAWLNLRVGKQHKIDGSDEETGALFTVSYSPNALLKK